MRELELLAPAANIEIAREAILHGADAVYIGASSHGARKAASNSVEEIARLVEFAHPFRAKVYVTVNTIVYDHELEDVRRLIIDLYRIGVDAIIVQDMALLRMDLPPIALHASTQCDTRTVAKAKFLEKVGFSQIVLARELTLKEIREVCESVDVAVECFIHGALCVSYSGRCHASQSVCGRSANRGECAQICRQAFNLTDANGKTLANNRHLLSLKDFNLSMHLDQLVEAGVSSFKIEGRLKDAAYVKNVTAFYRLQIDRIIEANPDKYRRSSRGQSSVSFTPKLDKSFNRGFTTYFLESRRPSAISSPLTPKSLGENVSAADLHNGDGISFFNDKEEYVGAKVNKVENGRIFTLKNVKIPRGAQLHRTFDQQWQKAMARPTAVRKIRMSMAIDLKGVSASDERGCRVRIPLDVVTDIARRPFDPYPVLSKLGNTIYTLDSLENNLPPEVFIPASSLSQLRQRIVEALDTNAQAVYSFDRRRVEDTTAEYPVKKLDYQDNVANVLAEKFFRSHGVREIAPAMEVEKGKAPSGRSVMTTRHCILREMGMCLRKGGKPALPLRLSSGNSEFILDFDCDRCEMHLLTS